MNNCPECGGPLRRDIKPVLFTSGGGPLFSLELKLDAHWCPKSGCYQSIKVYNQVDRQEDKFVAAVLKARDALRPIAEGVIPRRRALSQYVLHPGVRKTTIKDAREICSHAINRINQALNEFLQYDQWG